MSTVNTSPGVSTFDATPPHYPGTPDFNGCKKIDDSTDPPDPETMPNAPEWQTTQLTLMSIARMAPQLSVSVKVVGGVYSVDLFNATSSTLALANITVTKNSTGNVTVSVPTSFLAFEVLRPKAYVNQATPLTIAAVDYTATGIRGATVTLANAGTPADGSFTVDIF